MTRKLIYLAIIFVSATVIVLGTARVYAQSSQEGYPTIVQKIAEKFGLNENDVQAVFNENKQERQAQKQEQWQQRLDQAVADGRINEAQKQAILAKHQELQSNRQTNATNWQNLTPVERRAAMQTQRQELQSWAEQNNIDLSYFFGGLGMKGGWKIK